MNCCGFKYALSDLPPNRIVSLKDTPLSICPGMVQTSCLEGRRPEPTHPRTAALAREEGTLGLSPTLAPPWLPEPAPLCLPAVGTGTSELCLAPTPPWPPELAPPVFFPPWPACCSDPRTRCGLCPPRPRHCFLEKLRFLWYTSSQALKIWSCWYFIGLLQTVAL